MNHFRVVKIGLLNFWLYDEEEFDFYGGKLILRGGNGNGKSVTMQSFIPLILDGNKSPDRLDPFGSKERKIEDYILGYQDSIQKEEAISYLYMETYNQEHNQYITVGLGFRGRKGRPVESFGFALKDGKRIGKDFFLYKDPVNKIPLTKNELKSRLGTTNEMTDSMKDYKAMVNRLLFGFPNIDTYDEFIKLLLQLRSNKLSKDYKPTHLVNILNTVLQPLTEEDLRPLSEAIEQMNKTKEQIEKLEKNNKSLNDFLKVYRNYNELLLLTKARNYKKIQDEDNDLKKEIEGLEKELNAFGQDLETKRARFNKVIEMITVDTEAKKQLDNQDLKKKIESLKEIEENLLSLQEKVAELTQKIEVMEQDKIQLGKKTASLEEETYRLKKELETSLIDLKDLSSDSYFDEIVFFADELLEKLEEKYSFDSILLSLGRYKEKIKKIIYLLEEEQKKLLESESSRVALEKLVNDYNKLEQNESNQERNLKESILSWEEDFINKVNNNEVLEIDEGPKKKIFELMNDYTQDHYNEAKNIYQERAREQESSIKEENLNIQNKINIRKQEQAKLQNEYQILENREDLELTSSNASTEALLKEENIDFVPLYKCIEFKDKIDEETKNNMESALLELNILNAKIIKEEDIEKVKKLKIPLLYLTKTKRKAHNLLQYFTVTVDKKCSISKEYIEAILMGISVDEDDVVAVLASGIAKVDMLNSIADKDYKQQFIGYLKRKELKMKQLKELEEKITGLNTEINTLNNLQKENDSKITRIENEMRNFPLNTQIEAIVLKINEIRLSLNWNDQQQKELEEKLGQMDAQIKEIREKIAVQNQGLHIPLNLTSYKEVDNLTSSVQILLQDIKNTHNAYLNKLEIKNSYAERMEDLLSNITYLNQEKTEKETLYSVNQKNRQTITELLETKEYKDQKEELLRIENELVSLTKEKEDLTKMNARLEKDIEYKEQTLSLIKSEQEEKEKTLSIYFELFLREYKLHYVYTEDIQDVDTVVKKIISEGKMRKETSLNDALNNFYASYNHYSLELNDYSLRNVTLFNDYEGSDEDTKKLYEENTRVDVTTLYQGIKLNLIELSKKIQEDIEENKDLISKQDRHLFEDILLNTVGEKIRNRINASNEWVQKINNIMASMQKQSALRFKLMWKSVAPTTEDEMDTRELVRILKMDPKLLKDSDTEKLTNHFRSKIKKAEQLYLDSYTSFSKIISEVLDYRTWFTFQLFYQREDDALKELTDKTFSKFSGGERAKSMYIPLFASVYAKLNVAKPYALRLIALDEAFAGVDEDNIREMFGILKLLDIDFIINSQALWGDYDTIEDLSICELIKAPNAPVVTVERYRWNGKYKEIINNRKEYNEENNYAGIH